MKGLLYGPGGAAFTPTHTRKGGRLYLTLTDAILMPDADPETRQAMPSRLNGDTSSAPVTANVPLIRTDSDPILIDTGAGTNIQASTGHLAENLAAAGVAREAITKIGFTHAHPDHTGGTVMADGQLLFPNAHYFIGRDEWDFWTALLQNSDRRGFAS